MQDRPLTKRQAQIAQYVAMGLTNPEIADKLNISPKTVENHVKDILRSLNCKNRVQVAVKIIEARYK